jgi:hypothetical protein
MEKKKDQQNLEIELSQEIADGIYSNLAVISHSQSEFIIDFIRMLPNTMKASVKSRIVLTPDNAKRLLLALQDNIAKFEMHNGKIKTNDQMTPPMMMGGEA